MTCLAARARGLAWGVGLSLLVLVGAARADEDRALAFLAPRS